jgi:hypothetical protein
MPTHSRGPALIRTGVGNGHIKGVSLVSARRFVEQTSADSWPKILARLTPDHAQMVDEALVVGWYPIEAYRALLVALDDVLGDGRHSVLRPLGRFQAEHDLAIFYRLILRFWSPAVVIEKTAQIWGRYHDTGTWETARHGEHGATASVSGWLGSSEILCAGTTAYIVRLFELVGASNVRVRHPECTARTAKKCTWVVDWDA